MSIRSKWSVWVVAVSGAVMLAGTAQASVGVGTTIETMDSGIGTWDSLDNVPGSLTNEADTSPADGFPDSVQFFGGQMNINEAYIGAATHLQVNNVPTTQGVRLDATTSQGVFAGNLDNWGMGTTIHWDDNNWVNMQRIRDSGGGWKVWMKDGGTITGNHIDPGHMDNEWLMSGIEVTASDVIFYASPRTVDQFGSTDFDGQMVSLGSLGSRPAGWTGPASLIVGKGWDNPGGDPWDGQWDLAGPKVISVDTTRIIVVPEPASLALILAGGLVAFAARRRRS